MAKGKRVSSRASLLISVKILGVTLSALATKPRQCPLVRPCSKKKRNKRKIRQIKGLGKNASMTGTARLLQRHPQTTPALGLTMTGHP
jgi:hypothetical protein